MRQTSLTTLFKNHAIELQKNINTSIPGSVIAFNSTTQLAQIQIGVKTVLATGENVEIAPLIECPVCFQGGKDFTLEFQIDKGCEGIIIFSQRSIEDWMNEGGISNQNIFRFHDINDAMFIPGIRSNPNVINNFSNDGIRIRNNDSTSYFWLKKDGTAEIKATTINIDGTIINNGTDITNHTHSQANDSAGNTEQNTGGMI